MESESTFFQCTQCGDCCKGFGGTYLSETDMSNIAAHLDIPVADFKKQYCARSGSRYVLTQGTDGFCIFYDRNCTIHAIKPRMCRQWPFIDSLLKDITNWRIMASVCPGIRTDVDTECLRAFVCNALGKSPCPSK